MIGLNILHFIPVYKPAWRYGGPVRSVSELCEEMAAQGVAVTVFTTNADGKDVLDVPTNRPVMVNGVQVYYFQSNRMPWGIDSLALRKRFGRELDRFDLVHMSAMWQPLGLPVARAATQAGKPYICSLRGGVNPWAWKNRKLKHHLYWRLFEQRLLKGAAALHVTCAMEREEALSHGVGNDQEFITVPNGIRASDYVRQPSAAQAFRQLMGLDACQKIVFSLGRVHPTKGIDIFIKSAAEVLRASDEWLYVVVGPDDRGHRQQLVALTNELGIAGKVRFHDMLEGQMRLGVYSAADIFLLTSHNENFGMSVVEAMAASVPVLISDQVGISREIAADKAGIVTPLEPDAICQALARLMNSPELRHLYAQRGLECVRRRFEISTVAHEMIRAYENILSKTKAIETASAC